MHVTLLRNVDDALARRYWPLYDEAFAALRTASPCRQFLTEDEFMEEMGDPRILKFVLWDEDEAVGMALVAEELSAVPWVSPDYFAVRFPLEYAEGRLFYFGALLTAPHARRAGNAKRLLAALSEHVASVDGIAAFDCAAVNVPYVPDLVAAIADEVTDLTPQQIDSQHYYAYKTSGLKAGRRFARPIQEPEPAPA
jgi:GNAT superfamily N-acetyltransferase